ncbi:putative Eukaryotic translation initiation factor 4E [Hypsibius exemplaris]|uniref:Eukaryotic translation initiation factor 4E n=1 Tax=Hypsibius exemplaris TaxID=2072580 RepID=A0A1W0WSK4_HYPEX|nr:putative Eukaryotic translation initiation factor 4E [Hypsibius exemplaris]
MAKKKPGKGKKRTNHPSDSSPEKEMILSLTASPETPAETPPAMTPPLHMEAGNDVQEQENEARFFYHSLETPWTLFFLDGDAVRNSNDWSSANKQVISFQTVEEFWGTCKSIIPVADLSRGSDYSFFRGGLGEMRMIRPEWEDVANSNGGSWRMTLSTVSVKKSSINELYRELLMLLVGEQFDDFNNDVNGLVVSCRSGSFRFAIWTGTTLREACLAIGRKIAGVLTGECWAKLEFYDHGSMNINPGRGRKAPVPMYSLA